MPLLRVDPRRPEPDIIAYAAEVLCGGGLVAFPTETVYGLGAHAMDAAAVARIYEAKGRPAYNPIIVHVDDVDSARALASEWPPEADALARAFWPGPLTLVLPKTPAVPEVVTAGLPRVGLRVPANAVALALLRAAGIPIAAPSANRSMELSPTRAEHVVRALGEDLLVLDGGETDVGIESTVLDPMSSPPRVLRPGTISVTEIAAVLRDARAEQPRSFEAPSAHGSARQASSGSSRGLPREATAETSRERPRESPGQLDRHYSPRAEVRLFPTGLPSHAMNASSAATARGVITGAVTLGDFNVPGVRHVRLPARATEYASRLYSTLHSLDESGCEVVWIEMVPDGAEWDGVRDRLRRAAHSPEADGSADERA